MAKRTGSKLLSQVLAKDAAKIAAAGNRVTSSATRLEKAEEPAIFAKRIMHIPDGALLKLSVSSLNRMLVDKGIFTQLELQQGFLDEVERRGF